MPKVTITTTIDKESHNVLLRRMESGDAKNQSVANNEAIQVYGAFIHFRKEQNLEHYPIAAVIQIYAAKLHQQVGAQVKEPEIKADVLDLVKPELWNAYFDKITKEDHLGKINPDWEKSAASWDKGVDHLPGEVSTLPESMIMGDDWEQCAKDLDSNARDQIREKKKLLLRKINDHYKILDGCSQRVY